MSLEQPKTLRELILQCGENFGSAEFIKSSDRPSLVYSKFKNQFEYVEKILRAAEIGPDARVGVKIPNGPELASCLLCVMGSAACVPIHSDIPELELDRIVASLRLDAVIVPSEAIGDEAFWTSRAVKVIKLCTHADGAVGQFTLSTDMKHAHPPAHSVASSDVAIIYLTSGTTASPKHVPQTQSGVVHAAVHVSRFYRHAQDDCGLTIMPLNHGHGLLNGLLPVLVSGSSVVCGTRFEPGHFFDLYETFKPTWFTAIPTFYQALLRYASNRPFVLSTHRLRYVRTGSAHMTSSLMREVEAFFGVPVLMGYGSAEGSVITSNPIPPGINKSGTVGISCGGNEVAIMDPSGHFLGQHDLGEVVLRGKAVTSGYLDNPDANADLFANGWLRTGDLGKLDGDGYLTLVGRIKDQINRGGESISPLEIEEAIRTHPSVVNAAVFSIEHPTLGEEVAAAVVAEDKDLTKQVLTHYLSESISASKIPHEFLFVEELPLTNIGKVDKNKIATMLTEYREIRQQNQQPVNPRTDLEITLERVWTEVLKLPSVGVTDHFLDLGGDSLSATIIVNRISNKIGARLDVSSLFSCPTIAEQAQQIQFLLGEQSEHLAGSE